MRIARLLWLIVLIPLAGCAMNGHSATYPVEVKGAYTLDSGDVIRIVVYGEPELTSTYKVSDAGSVSVPLVGSVKVAGLTTQAAAGAVTAALSQGYLRDPSVAVEIEQYRPFFIEGAVKAAGQFPYVYGMTVRAAIATAGGFSDTADRSRAVLYRRQGSQMAKGVVSLDFPIHPGDTIVVSERWL